jgi:hypothetical protein
VVGPEAFFHGTHFYGRLLASSNNASMAGSSPRSLAQ